jgi:hypothetical protein
MHPRDGSYRGASANPQHPNILPLHVAAGGRSRLLRHAVRAGRRSPDRWPALPGTSQSWRRWRTRWPAPTNWAWFTVTSSGEHPPSRAKRWSRLRSQALDRPEERGTITGEGLAVGTPAYMAPEQAIGQVGVGPPADLYALGLLAFEVTTGRHPFDASTPAGLIAAHLTRPAPRLSTRIRDCPPVLDDLIPDCWPNPRAPLQRSRQTFRDRHGPRGDPGASTAVPGVAARCRARLSRGPGGIAPHHARQRSAVVLSRSCRSPTLWRFDHTFGDGIADELISTLGRPGSSGGLAHVIVRAQGQAAPPIGSANVDCVEGASILPEPCVIAW